MTVLAERIDGSTLRGEWVAFKSPDLLTLRTTDGMMQLALNDLLSITAEGRGIGPPSGNVILHLADGGRLYGELLDGATDVVFARTKLRDRTELPYDRLAGIELGSHLQFPKAAELFRKALAERLPGSDLLMSREIEGVKVAQGRIESIGPTEGRFTFGGQSRTFQTERLYGIVFAAGAAPLKPEGVALRLDDGAVIHGKIQEADSSQLTFDAATTGAVSVELSALLGFEVASDRIVYLSDLSPKHVDVQGLLHAPWPWRKDESASGTPLSLGGRKFRRGVGVHSRTVLRYDLAGNYERFVATVGVDDAVRPRGSVVLRIEGDEKQLLDTGLLTGADAPRDVIVDVTGVNELVLTVNEADGLDLSDQADWAGARLIKPVRKR
ncbi:MAG: NPCBM/NEW2 domain-containing protein [Planctomycetota bacterium]